MERDDAVEQSFNRTTSNSFVTSSQYALLETAPVLNDRRVIEAIKAHLSGCDPASSSRAVPSIIDPFRTTLSKDNKMLRACHVYLWKTLLNRFKLCKEKPQALPKVPKKVTTQMDNTLRRLRDPSDKTEVRSTEALEVQVAWNLHRVVNVKKLQMRTLVQVMQALYSLPTPVDFIEEDVRSFIDDIVNNSQEGVWEYLLQNEYQLTNRRASGAVRLYDAQTKLLDVASCGVPSFIELATPPNTGKTLMAAGLAMARPTSRIVFCCIIPSVYLHVARLWYHLGFYPTFVYGSRRVEPNYKLSRTSWDPLCPQSLPAYLDTVIPTARVFIVDLNLCRWFLDQLDASNDTVLFLDEPTIGLDKSPAFSHVPNIIARILRSPRLPATVIMSSATLPSSDQLLPITTSWKEKHPTGQVVRIDDAILTSSISLISSETGDLVLPHEVCQDAESIQRLIEQIPNDVVWLKAYSGPGVYLMRQAFKDVYGYVPTFKEAGLGTSKRDLSLWSARKYAIVLLQRVVRDFRKEFVSWRPQHTSFPAVSLNKMAMDFSPFVAGQTLIVSDSPQELARSMVEPLIAERKLRHLEQALKSEELREKSFSDAASKIKDPEERAEYEHSKEHHVPVTYVPEENVIHTVAHLRKYGGQDAMSFFPKEFIRRQPSAYLVRKVLNTSCSEWEKHAYLSGVIYTDVRVHTQSTAPLTSLIESALVDAWPIAAVGTEFTYGANTPASNVIVTKEFAEASSRNSIIQFINRVSRSGSTSHNGKAFLCRQAVRKLLSPDDGSEASVLVQAFLGGNIETCQIKVMRV